MKWSKNKLNSSLFCRKSMLKTAHMEPALSSGLRSIVDELGDLLHNSIDLAF